MVESLFALRLMEMPTWMVTIDAKTLRDRLENGENMCVVDIRSEENYEEYIDGSQNQPGSRDRTDAPTDHGTKHSENRFLYP